jgi:hypothetical protein
MLQAQHCTKPECRGWLLEQRSDNLRAGEAWACTVCGVSVPSHHLDGASGAQDRADALRLKWRQALTVVRSQVRAAVLLLLCAVWTVGCSSVGMGIAVRALTSWGERCMVPRLCAPVARLTMS